MDRVKLSIDGKEVDVPKGSTVLQAAEAAGCEIPVFCYHNRLKIAGNCRMCLVEVEGGPPKPAASCALPVAEGMKVNTQSEMVKKARKGVLEFLLINHPLDCPICDQGGECDLQDITMAYGRDRSRFQKGKRAVKDKYMGPIVKTFMTRCIHCTRCVRFAEDVAGTPELGGIFRGEKTEITTYLDQTLTSELSGNLVDLCPVGALTSRPYSFKGRPWELTKVESVDVMDGVGSNIRVDVYGNTVMRILPRVNEDVNEEWISDKTRYACDGLQYQRLDRPYIRRNGRLEACTWDEAFTHILEKTAKIKGEAFAAIAGDFVDLESLYALKCLLESKGSQTFDCRQDGAYADPKERTSYLFNTTIAGIDQADVCVMIGGHVRYDAPIINARLRKRYLAGGFQAYRIGGSYGEKQGPTFPLHELGDDLSILEEIAAGTHKLCKTLKAAKKPMLILSQEVLRRSDGAVALKLAREIAQAYGLIQKDWNGFNVLQKAASRVGGLDIGFVPKDKNLTVPKILEKARQGEIKVLYLHGADELDLEGLDKTFVIYQGHHGDKGAHYGDVILPGAAYTEKDGLYVNTEGRVQKGYKAANPPGDAKEDWKIIRALSEKWGKTLPFDTLEDLREALYKAYPVIRSSPLGLENLWGEFGKSGKVLKKKLPPWTGEFYRGDTISRYSKTMAACQDNIEAAGGQEKDQKKVGTHD